MATYPICTDCNTRRETCLNITAHKKFVKWVVNVHFGRDGGRLQKTFTTKELADIQERQWKTDYERGLLLPQKNLIPKIFSEVSQEWWTMAVGQNRIKNANASEKYRVQMFVNLFGRRAISSLTFKDGETWLDQRISKGLAVNTINRDMKPLKWIMDYAVKKGYITQNPFSDLKELKGANIRIRWMTEAEIDLLLQSCEKLRDADLKDIILVGLNTGFRKGNLERLTARDIGDVRITASKTKSGKPYDVPISPGIESVLKRLIALRPTGNLLNTVKMDTRFRDAAKDCGLYTDEKDPDKVTIHTLRHTFAALYLKRGGDIYKLSKLLGHSSIAITEKVYAHICPKDIDAQASLIGTTVKVPMFKVV